MVKVLIVEDSPVMQELLAYTLSSDPAISITGIAANGEEALKLLNKEKPDVIAMDWQMPKLNGLLTTIKIMETNPIPIVIVTGSLAVNDNAITFSLMEAGALAIVKKPHSINHKDYKNDAKKLIESLKLMSEVKMVRRSTPRPKVQIPNKLLIDKRIKKEIEIVVIGASTGGPLILQKILTGLPKDILVPILIVQHITQGFVNGFVEWLGKTSDLPIHVATHGDKLIAGHVYVAPDDCHMGVILGPRVFLSKHNSGIGLRPSVAYLFKTAAENFGSRGVGILLSGMGSDGASELKLMKDSGAITIAQDKESSVVHGMPGEAIKLGAAKYVLSPEEIISLLMVLIK
ncbi:MAG: chemotaxis response regulator protein-glutamate methylesterase [Bacteroidetes bacterium HGW-Bacteroidetes-17]|jgi:two-component system chemotaxis response regulator CheB|nr:MAG: chemotaxis response regulator protein-glutamate methylesterase [Bacteroidetes bacterium HGW-Bacteroidetes-17]